MVEDGGMYKEDAEKLAQQMRDDNPMVDILDIKIDPDAGGYVIVAYDNSSDEEFTVAGYQGWVERRTYAAVRAPGVVIEKVRSRHGRKTARLKGEWVPVERDSWPDHVCRAVDERRIPGEPLVEVEPAVAGVDAVNPGMGAPGYYGYDGTFLTMVSPDGDRVWRKMVRLANFSLTDLSDRRDRWRLLGFDLAPEPRAPMIEPTEDWDEPGVLDEVKQRLLDIAGDGFEAILVDGQTNATAYAWLLAGVIGLRVLSGWIVEKSDERSGSASMGYTELLHYRDVESSL